MAPFEVEIADGHEARQRPIDQHQGHASDHQAPKAEEAEQQAGEEVTEGKALEHSQPADVVPALGDSAIDEQAQDVKRQAPGENSSQGPGQAVLLQHTPHGEDQRDADDEGEQREDQVIAGDAPHALWCIWPSRTLNRALGWAL